MRRAAAITALLGVALLATGFTASTASATVLCKTATSPCSGGIYGKGTVIEASLKSGASSTLHPPIGSVECASSSIKGEVTSAGSEGANVTGTISTLSFSSCNATVNVLKKGTFKIEWTGGGSGTLVLEGLETTIVFAGFHCIFSGPVSIPLKGGEMASFGASSTMTRTGGSSGVFCGGKGESQYAWTVDYTVTTPEPLWVAEKAFTSTVLCKTAPDPCTGGTYGKGTVIEASLKSGASSTLHPPIGSVECASSSIKGEVTNAGGGGADVTGIITGLSFTECNATVHVLNKGVFMIKSPSEGNDTLVLEGFETTVVFAGFHCIFSGSVSIPLKGGEMASLGAGATVSRTGGTSGVYCGSTAAWTLDYTVTKPEPLYAAES